MLNLLGPYKYVLDFLVIAALAGAAAVGIHKYNSYQQDIGAARVQSQWDKATLEAKEAQRAREIQFQKEKDYAVSQAAKNAQIAAASAAAATQSNRVLDDTIKALLARSSTDTADANRKYATALATVFQDCSNSLREMGRIAQGHANDSKMMQEAWPK